MTDYRMLVCVEWSDRCDLIMIRPEDYAAFAFNMNFRCPEARYWIQANCLDCYQSPIVL